MTWPFVDAFLLFFGTARRGTSGALDRHSQHQLLTKAAGARHLESLRTPHPLSGPGARVFNHLI